jgi:hypothetical protein
MAQDMQEKLLETLPEESRLDQQIPAPQVTTRGMGNRDVQVENMMAEERAKEIVDEIENNPSVFQRMANYFMSFFQEREPMAEGGKFPDLNKDGEVTYADILKGRGVYAEGGDVDDQMGVLIAIQPSEDEMNNEMLPDGEMEDGYIDYIISNSLNPEEENYLLSKLEQDDQLSMLFDKVIETASEFSGAGPVEGPGSGISDSIPARLSDGEFVFTAKATEQIGADTLQRMMEDAEAEADQRQPAYNGGLMEEEQPSKVIESTVRVTKPVNRNVPPLGMAQASQLQTDDEIKKNMLNPNVNYIRS